MEVELPHPVLVDESKAQGYDVGVRPVGKGQADTVTAADDGVNLLRLSNDQIFSSHFHAGSSLFPSGVIPSL